MKSIRLKAVILILSLVVFTTSVIAGLLLYRDRQKIKDEILLDSLSYAQLTNNSIINAFENYYLQGSFLLFKKEVNPLIQQNPDIKWIQIIDKNNTIYYDSQREISSLRTVEEKKEETSRSEYPLEVIRNLNPSVRFSSYYLNFSFSPDHQWESLGEEKPQTNGFDTGMYIVFPHKEAKWNIVYGISYSSLEEKIKESIISLSAVLIIVLLGATILGVYFINSLINPLKKLQKGVQQIAEGGFGAQVTIASQDEIGQLAQTFNSMSSTLQQNTKELIEKEKITQELDIARDIQQNMIPKKSPIIPGLDIFGSLRPATQIGGDIFDYLSNKEDEHLFFIADVTGHGVPAGLVASITNSTLHSYSSLLRSGKDIMSAMNSVIYKKTKSNMFATAVLCRWIAKENTMAYTSAGHEQIIFYEAATQSTRLLEKGGLALGISPNIETLLQEKNIRLQAGDTLVFYTDGIPEAWKNSQENLGLKRFLKLCQSLIPSAHDAQEIHKKLLSAVDEYRDDYPQQDDITLLVIQSIEIS